MSNSRSIGSIANHDRSKSSSLLALVSAVVRRKATLAAGNGAALGVFAAAVWELRRLFIFNPDHDIRSFLLTATEAAPAIILLAIAGAIVGFVFVAFRGTSAERNTSAIQFIERVVPQSRNLLFTAWEAPDQHASEVSGGLWSIVQHRASRMAQGVDVPKLLPWKPTQRAITIALASMVLSLAAVSLLPSGAITSGVERTAARLSGTVVIHHIDVEIIPPAYTGRESKHVRDPARIEALEGSVLKFTISANAVGLKIATDSGESTNSKSNNESSFQWQTVMQRDGFLVFSPLAQLAQDTENVSGADSAVNALEATSGIENIQSAGDSESNISSQLITLTAIADQRPSVRITKPGHDLIVDSTRSTLPVSIEAGDDIGLRTLVLHYTKVSGAGEQFTFVEGELPLQISRASSISWSANGVLKLDSLLLEPGDLVVYRARVTDGKPGAPYTESDAFIAERTAEGGIAATGFALDPDEDRYRASQQMVILKTERLIAARPTLAAEEVALRAREIAMEQQRVRAEFVFMTGGEFEQEIVADEEGIADLDESHEAESESDLAAGRMVNRGRAALLSAVRSMSRAALALGETSLTNALRHEKLALDSLQEAFSRQRFLMRALSQRETLDPARRLTGTLDSIAREPHPYISAEPATVRKELRSILSEIQSSENRQSVLALSAIRVLQLDAGNPRAQEIARWLQTANKKGSRESSSETRAALDSATRAISAWLGTVTRIDAAPAGGIRP